MKQLKDHEVAQLVNELTRIGRVYGQTQQLRDRISQVVCSTLEVGNHRIKCMKISPSCIGKACGCAAGHCVEADASPEEAVTVHVPGLAEKEAVVRIRGKNAHLFAVVREKILKIRNERNAEGLRHLDDDTFHVKLTKPP